jgi:hypothetical protein
MNPGDVLEGRGLLLQFGRLVADVDYHLTIPRHLYFVIKPSGSLHLDYEDYLGGFILLAPADAAEISLTDYTLVLADKSKRTIRLERRYKQTWYQGEKRIAFWVKVLKSSPA